MPAELPYQTGDVPDAGGGNIMSQALGIGGFPHFAGHPYGWPQALGFRMEEPRLSGIMAAGPIGRAVLKLLRYARFYRPEALGGPPTGAGAASDPQV